MCEEDAAGCLQKQLRIEMQPPENYQQNFGVSNEVPSNVGKLTWPDFERRCGEVRTSTKIVLHLPWDFCTSPETSCAFPSERLNDISKWKFDKFLRVA